MEPLAYIHLALALEAATDTDYPSAISSTQNPKLLIWFLQQKLSKSSVYRFLAFLVALVILGITSMASASVKEGDRGKEVTDLQQRLTALGYFQGKVTGYFGSVTKQAVIQFQQDRGLKPDGVVGTNTKASLSEQPSSKSQPENSSSDSLLQVGDRGDQVTTIQQQLAEAGFSGGEPGIFDDATEDAVRQFQQAKKLKVDGIVGSETLAALSAINKSNSQPIPSRSPSWYDDKSVPLTPFIR